jgi:putative peptidoglycan lipid II flippase
MLLQGLGFVFSYLTAKVVAHYFGTGVQADVYFGALALAMALLFDPGEQLLTHSFLQPFVERRKHAGEQSAWRLASVVANLQAVILVVGIVAGVLLAPLLVRIALPKFTSDEARIAVPLLRIMFPAMLFMGLSTLGYVILNSYKRFALPASAAVAYKAAIVVVAVLFAARYGIAAVAVGVLVGGAVRLGVNLFGLRRKLPWYRLGIDVRTPGLSQVGRLMLPLLVGVLAGRLRPLVDNAIASDLDGGISSLRYARALVDMPVQIFPYALGIALFPFMTDLARNGNHARLGALLVRGLRVVLTIFVPLALSMLLLHDSIIRVLWMSGKFDQASVNAVSGPFMLYALGLPAFALETVMLQVFFAKRDTRTPTIIGLWTLGLHIAIAYGSQSFGLAQSGIALAYTASRVAKVLWLGALLRGKLGHIDGGDTAAFVAKLFGATVATGAVLVAVRAIAAGVLDPSQLIEQAGALAACTVAGVVAFLVVAAVLRLDEPRQLVDALRRRLRR